MWWAFVTTLGKVGGENLCRLFSQYIGLDTMMEIVFNTLKGAKALKACNKEGRINRSTGLYMPGHQSGGT
ncbi:hypothetical protein GIB67_028142 [Kingdonia uniflora]|uniref:Uncharacterized protein n=1 Tax=Kingdonia uniflora TaxID=39325 RepID=A0A7J7KZP6_9MAGN|nr:hypothetical protein GIB67_028142 [Kingdonia uniflora]